MSVEQRVRISCDNFDCKAVIHSGRGLTDARTVAGQSGWTNTIHYEGTARKVILQDFCPDHSQQTLDGLSWREKKRQRLGEEVARSLGTLIDTLERNGSAALPVFYERARRIMARLPEPTE